MILKPELFKDKFGEGWYNKLLPLFENGTMDKIFAKLKSRSREGYKILPESEQVFRCFKSTPYEELNVVMCALAPYYTIKQGLPAADGLLMSCSNTNYIQPSLSKFYDAMEKEYSEGMDLKMIRNPDLTYLAKQGVLMYNISLTTEIGKKAAHLDLWKDFTIYLFEEVISLTGVPVIFLGTDAARFKRYLSPLQWGLVASHPASAAYSESAWDTRGVFKSVDKILKDMNNTKIQWIEHYKN